MWDESLGYTCLSCGAGLECNEHFICPDCDEQAEIYREFDAIVFELMMEGFYPQWPE